MKGRDFALLTDLYELTMMQGYYETGAYNRKVVFDLFYRKNPSGNGFAITAGCSRRLNIWMGCILQKRTLHIWKALAFFPRASLTT